MPVNVSIVEDHSTYRQHVKSILLEDGSFIINKEFKNGSEILMESEHVLNDVILMDLKMPEVDGHEASKILLNRHPSLKIIILTLFDESSYILALNKIGVKGFLPKTVEPELLCTAIKCVSLGGYCCTVDVATVLQKNLSASFEKRTLSDFESEIIKFLCEGKSSKEIAELIHKSPRTVEDYRQKLYEKFNVANKEQLITKFLEQNLIH